MKTSKLQGAELDYWVARAEGIEHPRALRAMAPGFVMVPYETEDEDGPITRYRAFMPSSEWMDGGPIIERERIGIFEGARWPEPGTPPAQWVWYACVDGTPNYGTNLESYDHPTVSGPTMLVAAMRAFVASKFGDTVPDEQEPA